MTDHDGWTKTEAVLYYRDSDDDSEQRKQISNLREKLGKVESDLDEVRSSQVDTHNKLVELTGELRSLQDVQQQLHDRLADMGQIYSSLNDELQESRKDMRLQFIKRPVDMLIRARDQCEVFIRSNSVTSRSANELINQQAQQLLHVLNLLGLEELDREPATFDEDVHHALQVEPTRDRQLAGKIKDVIRTGYRWNGQIYRPTEVTVFKLTTSEEVSRRERDQWQHHSAQ